MRSTGRRTRRDPRPKKRAEGATDFIGGGLLRGRPIGWTKPERRDHGTLRFCGTVSRSINSWEAKTRMPSERGGRCAGIEVVKWPTSARDRQSIRTEPEGARCELARGVLVELPDVCKIGDSATCWRPRPPPTPSVDRGGVAEFAVTGQRVARIRGVELLGNSSCAQVVADAPCPRSGSSGRVCCRDRRATRKRLSIVGNRPPR